uniref:Putative endonuclease/reverse transcript n=1 Tax=Ixodes ricinus TaxID=34613 RepID=A0A0K8RKX0_IXORI
MAWTMEAAFLCFLLKLYFVEADFSDAVDYIHKSSQAIRLTFLDPMKFYVVGGTFQEDPLLRKDSGIPFMCGEVETRKLSEEKFSMVRRLWTERLTNKWLSTKYDMIPGTSPKYVSPNYMDAKKHIGNDKRDAGRMYLLLTDSDSCALYYHKESHDCELWERKRPGKDGLPSSFCSRYISACNNKTVIYYHKYPECHE